MNFQTWLESRASASKLAVFDFDGTLANTPLKPQGWKATDYIAPDNKIRKGETSWWVHPDSLADYSFNQQIMEEFKRARQDPQSKAVMLTGRPGMRTAHLVRGRFRQEGLFGRRQISANYQKALERHKTWPNGPHPEEESNPNIHDEYFAGDMRTEDDFPKTSKGRPKGDTLTHKKYVIEQKLMTDDIEEMDFWDDRESHHEEFVSMFQELLVSWPNLRIVRYHYISNNQIQTIPIARPSTPIR